MIFFWIFVVSVVVYFYYVTLIHARFALAAGPFLHTASPATDAVGVPLTEVDTEPDYLDMDALTPQPRPSLPVLPVAADADRVYRGGAAGVHPNVRAGGAIDLNGQGLLHGDRRQASRRERLRRAEDQPGAMPERREDDRRLASRRVWLRREDDHRDRDLVDITEAARILSATPETVEKWILTADLPFYMVTKGAVREQRFDRIELLGWLGAEDVMEARARAQREET